MIMESKWNWCGKMGKKYQVVLIGCGKIGREHIEDIYQRQDIAVTWVVDREKDRAAAFAREFSVPRFTVDYHEALADREADIAIIATNTASHLEIYQECVRRRKHVLLEKPVCSNRADGEKLFALARSSGLKTAVGHILRVNDSYQYIARLIHSGVIGRLLVMRMVQNHQTVNWERYKGLLRDCSPIVDCGVHYFDVMEWFSGEKITSLCGVRATTEPDLDPSTYNYGMVTATLGGGCVGYYEAGWGNSFSARNVKEFVCEKGRVILTMESCREDKGEGDKIEVYHSGAKKTEVVNLKSQYKPMYRQLKQLIHAIEEPDFSPLFTLEQARRAFHVSLAADEALRNGKIVKL